MRVNRNRCQYCRLKKCIAVGMSRDGQCFFFVFVFFTGWSRLIRTYLWTRFCFELSGNSNYNIKVLSCPLVFDEAVSRFEEKLRIKCKIRIHHVRINCVRPLVGFNWWTCLTLVLFWGHWISNGFQIRVDCLIHIAKANVVYLP